MPTLSPTRRTSVRDQPVLNQRQGQHLAILKDAWQFFVTDAGKRRIHHQHEPDGDQHIGRADGKPVDCTRKARHESAEQYTERHSCENRSEEHTSELQSLMRLSYAVFCLNKK